MRGLAFEYLVMNWGPVPVIENNIDLLEDPLSVRRNTVSSVWEFITRDFLAAARDLAEGMLARTHLTRAGVEGDGGTRAQMHLDSAKHYAQRVIDMSGASLLSNYEDLFLTTIMQNLYSLCNGLLRPTSGEATTVHPPTRLLLDRWAMATAGEEPKVLLSGCSVFTKVSI